jgi:hypothetical protein
MTHRWSTLVLSGWALLAPQISRCFPEERVGQGRLRPGA